MIDNYIEFLTFESTSHLDLKIRMTQMLDHTWNDSDSHTERLFLFYLVMYTHYTHWYMMLTIQYVSKSLKIH